jgi:RNA polymerase sigma-70 factor (sigma-E family)
VGMGALVKDETAFAGFVSAHSRSLFGTAYLLTGSVDAAEDLVQDTLASLYPKWGRVAAADAPLAYVRRALTNRFLSARRASHGDHVALWEVPDVHASADVAESVVNREHLWKLLGSVPERQRAAIVLRYFHGLSDGEIAEHLGCRAVTVRSLLSRGIAGMRERSGVRVRGDQS